MNTNPYDQTNGYTPPPGYPDSGTPPQQPYYPPAGNYPQQSHQSYPNPYTGQHPFNGQPYEDPAGAGHARTSLICGIIGIFIFGLVLGPIAIWQAGKAEALGVRATPGKVTGWIAFVLSALWFVFSLLTGFSGSFSFGS